MISERFHKVWTHCKCDRCTNFFPFIILCAAIYFLDVIDSLYLISSRAYIFVHMGQIEREKGGEIQ